MFGRLRTGHIKFHQSINSSALKSIKSAPRHFSSISITSNVSRNSLKGLAAFAGIGTTLYLSTPNTVYAISDAPDAKSSPVAVTEAISKETEQIAQDRIISTYGYTIGGLIITVLAGFGSYASGLAATLLTMNPLLFFFGNVVGSLGFLFGTLWTDARRHPLLKHTLWALYNAFTGVTFGFLGYLSGPLVLQAAAATGAMVGSLSLVGALLPRGSSLVLRLPLTIGLGLLSAIGIGRIFWPQVELLSQISLYGGLCLFGVITVVDTDVILSRAAVDPRNEIGFYDPINMSISIYLDVLNIFLKVLEIMMDAEDKKKKRRGSVAANSQIAG